MRYLFSFNDGTIEEYIGKMVEDMRVATVIEINFTSQIINGVTYNYSGKIYLPVASIKKFFEIEENNQL